MASIQAKIIAAKECSGHVGDEQWAIRTICQMSDLDVTPHEVTILRHDKSGDSPTGARYVMSGGVILGSYSLSAVE